MTSALVLLALLAANPRERQVLSVDPSISTVRFHVNHKLHHVDGNSKKVEGKVVVEPDGRVMTMVRIDLSTFDSGDGNRDAHMRETLDVARFPFVVFKGVGTVTAPRVAGQSSRSVLAGELDFHGVKRSVEVPVTVEFTATGGAKVHGSLKLSLDAYQVERPSLLFVKLDDACAIDFDLALRAAP